MKLQKQDSNRCLLYATAMLLDVDALELGEEIGVNDQEIWFPNQTGVKQYRSYHIREMIEACIRRGYALCPLEASPLLTPDGLEVRELWDSAKAKDNLVQRLWGRKGLLICNGHLWHACAWDGEQVYNPQGSIDDLNIWINRLEQFWMLTKLIS